MALNMLQAVRRCGAVWQMSRRLLSTTATTQLIKVTPVLTQQQRIDKRQKATAVDASVAAEDEQQMFCFQCEQTRLRKGCTTVGVCGKTHQVAELQDLLVHAIRGLSVYSNAAAKLGVKIPFEIYDFTLSALFSTLTNVNFDPDRFPSMIKQAIDYREQLKTAYEDECETQGQHPHQFTQIDATWMPDPEFWDGPRIVIEAEGKKYGVLRELQEYGADINGVRQLIVYGLKGMATYARHARFLGAWDDSVGAFTHEAFSFLVDGDSSDRHSLEKTLEWALKVGECNLTVMRLLDEAHRNRFGKPSPAQVRTTPVPGKSLLVTGHDLHDLDVILKATEGKGINVYTHGEMLPAHGYPGLRQFKHLVGHYGGAWQNQKFEFPGFRGPIVVTTNCMIEPMKSYKDRLFTLNETGWPGVQHIQLPGEIDKLIAAANNEDGFQEADCHAGVAPGGDKVLSVGFGHDVILANADKVLGAVASGELKRIFVIGGCDGSENKRSYFTTLADSLPRDTLILTMGCAKYRFNRHDFGMLGSTGLPRLLDLGQCNDAYGAIVVATALAGALKTDINSLPLSITFSWFEQKAVAVFLTMLHLGIFDMRMGPVLPAFITPKVADLLQERYHLVPCDMRHAVDDMNKMLGERVQV